jgi:hypothetical protein
VEAVARGIRPEWLVVLTPADPGRGPAIAGSLLAGRAVDMLVVDLPTRLPKAVSGTGRAGGTGGEAAHGAGARASGAGARASGTEARFADRLGRLAALARRAGITLVVLEPPSGASNGSLAGAIGEATGIRLELARRSWIRLGRDVVGQRTEVSVARSRAGPPGRRATLRILYADGGERDACLRRDDLLDSWPVQAVEQAPVIPVPGKRNDATSPSPSPTSPPRLREAPPPSGSWPQGPIVLGGAPWSNGNVLDADPIARALGVRRGMPLGSAHRLAPEATFLDADPEADRTELEAAFERLAAFSPAIAGTSEPSDVAFGLLEAQIDGLEGLWGVEPTLVERVGGALEESLAGRPRAGIAGTRFAATVAALAAEPGSLVSVPVGAEAEFLAPLPASLLTPDADIRARLRRFGLRRIGQVAELAASALVARFGEEGAAHRVSLPWPGDRSVPTAPRAGAAGPRAADRACGHRAGGDPVRPPAPRHRARCEPRRAGSRRGAGPPAPRAGSRLRPLRHPAGAGSRNPLPRAHRRRRGDRAPAPRKAGANAAVGRRLPAGAGAQWREPGGRPAAPLFVPQALHGARLAWQLARLALTYGEDRIRRVEVTDPEAPLPERRWAWRDVGAGT